MRKISKSAALLLILIIVITVGGFSISPTGCGLLQENTDSSPTGSSDQTSNLPSPTMSPTMSPVPSPTPSETENIGIMLSGMTVEEKVGQLFTVSLRRLPSGADVKEMNSDIDTLISKYKVGGIILFSENIDTISQTSELIKNMQSASTIPLFISVDEEGGRISRISSNPKMHGTEIPTNQLIGKVNDLELTERIGNIIAQEISSLGFNMDFAPVADVNTNPKNPVIGDRAFGSNASQVSNMVAAEVKGIQGENVSAVIKHFPGHGDTATDTHTGSVTVNHDLNRLRRIEFKPFIGGINAGADGVMVSHIIVPKVGGAKIPSTFSKKIVTDILRNELGFKGLIITDALDMGAITKYYGSGTAAVKAFNAGVDILLMPYNINNAYNGILNAVNRGDISQERLNESVRRVLETKMYRKILDGDDSVLDPEMILGSPEHKAVIQELLGR